MSLLMVKRISITGLDRAWVFQDDLHLKVVRLSALRTGRHYSQEIFWKFMLEAESTSGP